MLAFRSIDCPEEAVTQTKGVQLTGHGLSPLNRTFEIDDDDFELLAQLDSPAALPIMANAATCPLTSCHCSLSEFNL